MGLFDCATTRKPTAPVSTFKVHRPPSSEWLYGNWVGPSHPQEFERRKQAERDRERRRQPTEPPPIKIPQSTKSPQPTKSSLTRTHFQKPQARHPPPDSHPASRGQRRRERAQESGSQWPTLAEIEANERYGPRGRGERYERPGADPVDARYEPAYAKLIIHSDRQGRSRRLESLERERGGKGRGTWDRDGGVKRPQVGKFREGL